jgi:hypothetical protein
VHKNEYLKNKATAVLLKPGSYFNFFGERKTATTVGQPSRPGINKSREKTGRQVETAWDAELQEATNKHERLTVLQRCQ